MSVACGTVITTSGCISSWNITSSENIISIEDFRWGTTNIDDQKMFALALILTIDTEATNYYPAIQVFGPDEYSTPVVNVPIEGFEDTTGKYLSDVEGEGFVSITDADLVKGGPNTYGVELVQPTQPPEGTYQVKYLGTETQGGTEIVREVVGSDTIDVLESESGPITTAPQTPVCDDGGYENQTVWAGKQYSGGYNLMTDTIDDVGIMYSEDKIYVGGVSGSAIELMNLSMFFDAIEAFRSAKSTFKSAISVFEETRTFARECHVDSEYDDMILDNCDKGIDMCGFLIKASDEYEKACKVYLDNDADYEDDVPEADEHEDRAIEYIKDSRGSYPISGELMMDRIQIYNDS